MKEFLARGAGNCAADARPAPIGFLCNSIILTLDGAMPVEFLSAGDRVITRDCGIAELRAVNNISSECETITVKPGTLGTNRPDKPVLLPAEQKVLLRDWRAKAFYGQPQALAPIHQLVDEKLICRAGRKTLSLIQLEFDAPHILYVDGLELVCETAENLRNAA